MCPIETKKDYTESEITLRILIKDYELTNVPCLVKKYVKPKESSRAYFGLKFLDKSVSFSTDLHGLLVYLDRVQRGKVLE